MQRRYPSRLIPLAALTALLLVPAAALAAPKPPTVTAVTPLRVGIGDKMTISGNYFIPGRLKNTVVFQRAGGRPVFVKADTATATQIVLTVPLKLRPFLFTRNGAAQYTRFRLRVLARRFQVSFTGKSLSPEIGPISTQGPGAVAPPGGIPVPPTTDCDGDKIDNSAETDDDNDLIEDTNEVRFLTNPCNPDSDGDTVLDGFEYESAVDLNGRQSTNPAYQPLPYPGKKPYPNPLDARDGCVDFDGDGLMLCEEFQAWKKQGPLSLPLRGYNDGDQTTDGVIAVPPGGAYLDTDSNNYLSDDEKDVDQDGLGNFDEIRGAFDKSNKGPDLAYFPQLDWLDPETDGDGLTDGLDDQDHDDISNVDEIQDPAPDATRFHNVTRRVDHTVSNALSPCDPNPLSRSCPLHPPD